MSDIERQIKLEADARYEDMLRYAKNRQYQLATDLKPVRDLLSSWTPCRMRSFNIKLERGAAKDVRASFGNFWARSQNRIGTNRAM